VKLYVDLETLQLIEGPGFRSQVSALRFKRGDACPLELSFLKDGSTRVHMGDPSQLQIQFGLKPRLRYDVGYLVSATDWQLPATDAEAPVYLCQANFNTSELDSALGLGRTTGTELDEIILMGEISWNLSGELPTSTRTFQVVVENDVNRGNEGVPVSASPPYPSAHLIETRSSKGIANGYAPLDAGGKIPAEFLPGGSFINPDITTHTGTGSDALSSIATIDLTPGHVVGAIISGVLSFYQLQNRNDDSQVPGTVRPNDFDTTANTKVWIQVL
jgi:hypothetical protein